MRKPYNTTCDIVKGPLSGDPFAFVGTFACRKVFEDAILGTGVGCPEIDNYLTIDEYEPVGAWTFPTFGMEPGLADQVAIPSESELLYWVLYTDRIVWKTHPPYWRSYLVSLPLPAVIGSGGVIADGSAVWSGVIHPSSFGGVLVNGKGISVFAKNYTGHGGVEVNRRGKASIIRRFFGLGGVLLDSTAKKSLRYQHVGSGGCECDSPASWWVTHRFFGRGAAEVDSGAGYGFHPGSGSGGGFGGKLAVTERTGLVYEGHTVYIMVGLLGLGSVLPDNTQVTISGCTIMPEANGVWHVALNGGIVYFLFDSPLPASAGGYEPSALWHSP
jgi:hypothetical protein